MRVGYLVSRFPHVSETFIVRELDAVESQPGIELELLSLFPAREEPVHPSARRWVPRLRRPGWRRGLVDLLWWALRRPLRLSSGIALVVAGCLRSPSVLGRSLGTVPLAASHARWLRRDPVDHLHAHYATYPALAAWLCNRLTGIPYSFTVHAHDLFVDQSMLHRKLGGARFVVAISAFNRDFLGRYGGGDATPVYVVHCGVEPGLYRFRARRIPQSGPVRVLCVASLQEYKGHRILLEALAADQRLGRIRIVLAGSGPLLDRLLDQSERLGLGGRVDFRGALTEEEVRAEMDRADLFVLPSIIARNGQMEGLPVVLMEALACGLPVVATRLSGIPEIVVEGRTGLLAAPGDPASLAAALAQALEGGAPDPSAGRRMVEAEFDVGLSAERLAALFQGQSPDHRRRADHSASASR